MPNGRKSAYTHKQKQRTQQSRKCPQCVRVTPKSQPEQVSRLRNESLPPTAEPNASTLLHSEGTSAWRVAGLRPLTLIFACLRKIQNERQHR